MTHIGTGFRLGCDPRSCEYGEYRFPTAKAAGNKLDYTCHTVVDSDLCLAIMIDITSHISTPINVSTTRI
jgi:hypothetical protein